MKKISVTKVAGEHWFAVWLARNDVAARQALKRSIPGRRWSPDSRCWLVPASSAPQLQAWADEQEDEVQITDRARELMGEVTRAAAASSAVDAEIEVPGLAGELRPFQRAGVAYALARKRVILGDEQGLGKTVQAIATAEAAGAYPCLVACPASLKLSWEREVQRWLPHRSVRAIGAHGGGQRARAADEDALREAEIVVVNYELLTRHRKALLARPWRMIVADEAHYLRSGKAQRTRLLREIAQQAEYRLLLTGTPVVNRPADLIAPLKILDRLSEFGGWKGFTSRYCGARETRWGLDISGATNLDELAQKLRASCFVRREKSEVLSELPPKQRAVVPLDYDVRDYVRAFRQVAGVLAEIDPADRAAALRELNALRLAAARAKLASVIAWVREFLESGDAKLVLFAHHREIQTALAGAFPGCARIGGDQSAGRRQDAVDRFQNDPACRLIVCSLSAAGVGLTLTAASHLAVAELPWTAAELDQAEDRVHRIGQRESVNVYYLLAFETIDERMYEVIESKREVADAAQQPVVDEVLSRLRRQAEGDEAEPNIAAAACEGA